MQIVSLTYIIYDQKCKLPSVDSYMFKLQLQASLLLDYYYENFNTALTL